MYTHIIHVTDWEKYFQYKVILYTILLNIILLESILKKIKNWICTISLLMVIPISVLTAWCLIFFLLLLFFLGFSWSFTTVWSSTQNFKLFIFKSPSREFGILMSIVLIFKFDLGRIGVFLVLTSHPKIWHIFFIYSSLVFTKSNGFISSPGSCNSLNFNSFIPSYFTVFDATADKIISFLIGYYLFKRKTANFPSAYLSRVLSLLLNSVLMEISEFLHLAFEALALTPGFPVSQPPCQPVSCTTAS